MSLLLVIVVPVVAKSLLWTLGTLWTRVGWGGNRDMEARGLNEGMSVGQEEGANIPTVDHIRPPITPDY